MTPLQKSDWSTSAPNRDPPQLPAHNFSRFLGFTLSEDIHSHVWAYSKHVTISNHLDQDVLGVARGGPVLDRRWRRELGGSTLA